LTNADDLALTERKSGSVDGVVAISAIQLGDLPEGIIWRNPQRT
jgi:hypothetical protein